MRYIFYGVQVGFLLTVAWWSGDRGTGSVQPAMEPQTPPGNTSPLHTNTIITQHLVDGVKEE